MARGVVIGGFASGQSHVDRVAEGLSCYYDTDFEGVSFRAAMADRGRLERQVRRATVFTHSAGMLAIRDTMPSEIVAVAPPLPMASHRLIARAALSVYGMALSTVESVERFNKVRECGRDAVPELLLHPGGNLGELGSIAAFNALETGMHAQAAGIATSIAFMDRDRFFRPSQEALAVAAAAGVTTVELSGHHDEILCYPEKTAAEFEAKRAAVDSVLVV